MHCFVLVRALSGSLSLGNSLGKAFLIARVYVFAVATVAIVQPTLIATMLLCPALPISHHGFVVCRVFGIHTKFYACSVWDRMIRALVPKSNCGACWRIAVGLCMQTKCAGTGPASRAHGPPGS